MQRFDLNNALDSEQIKVVRYKRYELVREDQDEGQLQLELGLEE